MPPICLHTMLLPPCHHYVAFPVACMCLIMLLAIWFFQRRAPLGSWLTKTFLHKTTYATFWFNLIVLCDCMSIGILSYNGDFDCIAFHCFSLILYCFSLRLWNYGYNMVLLLCWDCARFWKLVFISMKFGSLRKCHKPKFNRTKILQFGSILFSLYFYENSVS